MQASISLAERKILKQQHNTKAKVIDSQQQKRKRKRDVSRRLKQKIWNENRHLSSRTKRRTNHKAQSQTAETQTTKRPKEQRWSKNEQRPATRLIIKQNPGEMTAGAQVQKQIMESTRGPWSEKWGWLTPQQHPQRNTNDGAQWSLDNRERVHGGSEESVAHLYNKAGLQNLSETEGNEISAGILHEEPRMCVREEKKKKCHKNMGQ